MRKAMRCTKYQAGIYFMWMEEESRHCIGNHTYSYSYFLSIMTRCLENAVPFASCIRKWSWKLRQPIRFFKIVLPTFLSPSKMNLFGAAPFEIIRTGACAGGVRALPQHDIFRTEHVRGWEPVGKILVLPRAPPGWKAVRKWEKSVGFKKMNGPKTLEMANVNN